MSVKTRKSTDSMFEKLSEYSEWIFDMDNTLFSQLEYDSTVFHALEINFHKKYGTQTKGLCHKLVERKRALGPFYPKLFDDVLLGIGLQREDIEDAIKFYHSFRPDFISQHNLLQHLSEHKGSRPVFVVTNGHFELQKHKAHCLGLDRLTTEVIYCDKSCAWQLKPSPWAWKVLTSKYQFEKPIFVGDSDEVDGAFARNIGIDFYQFEYCYEDC